MKWYWKLKRVIYDPTIRRVGPIHSLIRFLVWHLSDILYNYWIQTNTV